ncbi:hypothetical protein VTO73DRAFT_5857 [Trametes versicolor]
MNVAHTSFIFLLLTALTCGLLSAAAAATACDGIKHSFTSISPTNCTVCSDDPSPGQLRIEPRCYVHHSDTLLIYQTSLFDSVNDDPSLPPLLYPMDTQVCHAPPTMLPLVVPHRNRPPHPASSAVISVPPDGNESSSQLAALLRACSLWELVSLASAVAWLFVCIAT